MPPSRGSALLDAWGSSAWSSSGQAACLGGASTAAALVGTSVTRDSAPADTGGGAPVLGSTLQSWPRDVVAARSERVRGAAADAGGGAPPGKRRKGGADVLEWARRLGVCPAAEVPRSAADVLAARARLRAVAVLDQGKLRSALAWAEDYVSATGGRAFFETMRGPFDADTSEHNWCSLDGFAEYVRAAGSRVRGREGATVKADYIQSLGSSLRILREEATGLPVLIPRAGPSRLFKAMRQDDGPAGSRDTRRALRAHHLAELADAGYHRESAARRSDWEAAIVSHNLLLRGGEAGRVEGASFDVRRGFTWGCIEWRAPSATTRGRAWLVAWICAIKDQSATNKRQPVVVCQRNAGVLDDPLCAYCALYARWRRVVGTPPTIASRARSLRLRRGHHLSDAPVFAHDNGVAYDTGDMRRIAQGMAAACGEEAARFGGKSFRVGGATDLRAALGAAEGMAVIKQRGRWNSDIAEIYQRALVLDQLDGSAAMGGARGADLEGLLDGWSQPA